MKLHYPESPSSLRAYRDAVNEAAIVSITDTAGTILYVNDKFLEISQYTATELIGKNHRIINSGYHPAAFFEDLWHTITSGKHWRGQIRNRAKDGSIYWVDTVIVPICDRNNNIYQFLSVRNLISAQKETEARLLEIQEELTKRERQLKDAQYVSKVGSWHMDLAASKLDWSDETYRMFGLPPGSPVSYELFLSHVHPEDRATVDACWNAALKGAPYSIEHRIITPDGEKWVSEEAKIAFDDQNQFISATGTVQDITEKKKTQQTLLDSERLYKSLFNHSPFPKGIVDSETLEFLEVNDTAVEFYGFSREEFLHMSLYDVRVSEEHALVRQQLFDRELAWGKVVRAHHKKDGSVVFVDAYISQIVFRGKAALLITIVDITEKLRLEKKLVESELSRQKEINRASFEAMEAYRTDVGRELHDNVNQLLASANIFLRSVHPASDNDRSALDRAMGIVTSVIREIRSLSWSLVPPSLTDFTLKESVENLSFAFSLSNTAANFKISIDEQRLDDDFKINLYRIIQEQFHNIIKYAKASRVDIRMQQDAEQLTLQITDNGQGFDATSIQKGIGLANIVQRAETYHGKAIINSEPGKGCTVDIVFPLRPVK